jgi:hypothetical protein
MLKLIQKLSIHFTALLLYCVNTVVQVATYILLFSPFNEKNNKKQ